MRNHSLIFSLCARQQLFSLIRTVYGNAATISSFAHLCLELLCKLIVVQGDLRENENRGKLIQYAHVYFRCLFGVGVRARGRSAVVAHCSPFHCPKVSVPEAFSTASSSATVKSAASPPSKVSDLVALQRTFWVGMSRSLWNPAGRPSTWGNECGWTTTVGCDRLDLSERKIFL